MGAITSEGVAPTLESQFTELRLLEDRSTYSKNEEWVEGVLHIKHTLRLFTPIEYSLPSSLDEALEYGFAAQILLNSLNEIEVGVSGDSLETLWLISCSTVSGERPSSRGYKEWLFETIEPEEVEPEGPEEPDPEGPEEPEPEEPEEINALSSLMLCVAAADGSAPQFDEQGVQITLFENLSSYSEEVEYIGTYRSVTHTLKVATPIDYTLPEELSAGLTQGFMALIGFNQTHSISVGWSLEATSHRALRLVSGSIVSSTKSELIYYKEWVLKSVDGVSNIN